MNGKLLLIIPRVAAEMPTGLLVDEHFGNNLRAYLDAFDKVIVACPAMPIGTNMIPLGEIQGFERCSIIILPEPYREDRFYRNYSRVSKILRAQIDEADYLLISPHAAFDWSTLATRIALAMGRDYNMEGDWDLQNVVRSQLAKMKFGVARLRKTLWHYVHTRYYLDSMRKSRLSLLQGAAVFEAYKDISPNPHKVLNVQVSPVDRISDEDFGKKIQRIRSGAPLRIAYTGRAIAMKGPEDWQQCLQRARSAGLQATATWLGDGEQLDRLRVSAADRQLLTMISYRGEVARADAYKTLKDADIFLFCHLTDESPRCLTEALTAGTPIVGYASLYACDLVAERGGGEFVPLGDWMGLADRLMQLDHDRERLVRLLEAARDSSLLYERDAAIDVRIRLMRQYLRPPLRPHSGEKTTSADRQNL